MSEYNDLIEHGFSESEAAEALDLAVAAKIAQRRVRARHGIGCDGALYHGWQIMRRWNAPKAAIEFVATNTGDEGVVIVEATEWRVKQTIDTYERRDA